MIIILLLHSICYGRMYKEANFEDSVMSLCLSSLRQRRKRRQC